jgi:hypothetical protein
MEFIEIRKLGAKSTRVVGRLNRNYRVEETFLVKAIGSY